MHRHHLIPRHMGGDDEEENRTPPISIQLHAEFHRVLHEDFGCPEDYIAWRALSGRITGEEARLEAAKVGQAKSKKYQERNLKHHLDKVRTKESCSKGGKVASKTLVQWIKGNKEQHAELCRQNGKGNGVRQMIPHEYDGKHYESKKALQEETGLSNTGFYNKLKRGEINRLPRNKELEGPDEP